MGTATPKYEVFSYERLAMNGGTSIYQAKEEQSPLTDQLKVTKNIGRSRTKTKLWLSEQIDNGNFGQPTTAMYGTDQVRWLYGDLEAKKNLIIFEYRQSGQILRLFYFKNFYPKNSKRFVSKFIRQ